MDERPSQQQQQQSAERKRPFSSAFPQAVESRGNHSEQLDELRRALPPPPPGVELSARAQVLEYTMSVLRRLMQRATFLAVELAVASPDATSRWVRNCSAAGTKPFMYTIAAVMKLFATRKDWVYAEWWTLNERRTPEPDDEDDDDDENNQQTDNALLESFTITTAHTQKQTPRKPRPKPPTYKKKKKDQPKSNEEAPLEASDRELTATPDDAESDREKGVGVIEDPGNVHGCAVRDSESVMRLAWTLVHKGSTVSPPSSPAVMRHGHTLSPSELAQRRDIAEFARQSKPFEFRPRVGMPGRVWTSRRAEWLTNLSDPGVFIRSPLAEQFGMQTCLAVPVQFGGHVHSVMAFFSQQARPFDSDSYELACHLAKCLEDVYSPSRPHPWMVQSDGLFGNAPHIM